MKIRKSLVGGDVRFLRLSDEVTIPFTSYEVKGCTVNLFNRDHISAFLYDNAAKEFIELIEAD